MLLTRRLLAVLSVGALLALAFTSTAEARITLKSKAGKLTSHKSAKLSADCCPDPCIVYRHCGPKLCCGCDAPQELVLKVPVPCSDCTVDVPVCLPACCEGEPEVCFGTGIFCRNVVEYQWCCGYSVRVVFRHRGDLLVKIWGY